MLNRSIMLQFLARSSALVLGLLFVIATTSIVAVAQHVREVQWSTLIPPLAPYDDPFLTLSAEQKLDLAMLARARTVPHASEVAHPSVAERLQAAIIRLQAANINIDELLAKRSQIAAKRREAAEAVNKDFEGQLVEITGYLLPLTIEAGKVIEFLLVPYVGACIHEPTPPPNQIVHVKFGDGLEVTSRFAAVSVTGPLRAARSQPLLRLVDGAANVPAAYAIHAQSVQFYAQARKPQPLWRLPTGPAFQ